MMKDTKATTRETPRGRIIGDLTISKVIHEHTEIRSSAESGLTIGNLVDQRVAEMLRSGTVVREIRLEFSEESWTEMLREFLA